MIDVGDIEARLDMHLRTLSPSRTLRGEHDVAGQDE
jgi:hypothetical protein